MAEPSQKKAAATDAAIDLRTVGVADKPDAAPQQPAEPFREKPYDPSPARENIRGRIALWLIYTLVGVIALITGMALIATGACLMAGCSAGALELTALRVLVELVLTPLVGLVGAVTGFYFGEKSAAPPLPQEEPGA